MFYDKLTNYENIHQCVTYVQLKLWRSNNALHTCRMLCWLFRIGLPPRLKSFLEWCCTFILIICARKKPGCLSSHTP